MLASLHLQFQQLEFAAHLPGDGGVLLRPAQQVRHGGGHLAVGQVLGGMVTGIGQVKGQVVAHAVELGEVDALPLLFGTFLPDAPRQVAGAELVVRGRAELQPVEVFQANVDGPVKAAVCVRLAGETGEAYPFAAARSCSFSW